MHGVKEALLFTEGWNTNAFDKKGQADDETEQEED